MLYNNSLKHAIDGETNLKKWQLKQIVASIWLAIVNYLDKAIIIYFLHHSCRNCLHLLGYSLFKFVWFSKACLIDMRL